MFYVGRSLRHDQPSFRAVVNTFGMGPMALLKQIRLGQVQHVCVIASNVNAGGCSTVQEVANHFGFHSRNHFARDYRNLFGEAPPQTLARSAV